MRRDPFLSVRAEEIFTRQKQMISLAQYRKYSLQIVQSRLGPIDWLYDEEGAVGDIPCPGEHLHSTPTKGNDCRVYVPDFGPITIHCFHDSCKEVRDRVNYQLRLAIGQPPHSSASTASFMAWDPERAAREAKRDRKRSLEQQAGERLMAIKSTYSWSVEEILRVSPNEIPEHPADHFHEYLRLYSGEDILWIGTRYDSGSDRHAANFRRVNEWMEEQRPPGEFVCPSIFKPGSFARRKENLVQPVMLVVECDTIDPIVEEKLALEQPLTEDDLTRNKNQSGAIFRWLRDRVELRLRAVVDAGNKSLHAHFEHPGDGVEDLKTVLPHLKCDRKVLQPTQPVRIPGVRRGGKFQKLIYLDLNP